MQGEMVSIIMAAYNSEKTIGDAIESVIKQSHKYWELIVVIDGSFDRTNDIVEGYVKADDRIRVVVNEMNQGVSKCRYKGAQEAKADWIAILDSDDMWTPKKLEYQLVYQKKYDADIVYTASSFIDANGNAKSWIMEVPRSISYRKLLSQNIISNSSALVKKDLYIDNYVFGDDMHEDYALWLNILKKGYKAVGINKPLLIYRLSDNSKSSNKLKAAKMNYKTLRNVGINIGKTSFYMVRYGINGIKKYRKIFGK